MSNKAKPMSKVISFRLPPRHVENLKKKFKRPENKVVGVDSEDQLLRKVAIDWLNGQLIYISPHARKANPILEPAWCFVSNTTTQPLKTKPLCKRTKTN